MFAADKVADVDPEEVLMIISWGLRWALTLALASAALAAGALSARPSEAAPNAADPFDFNGDGYADLATGVPGESLRSVEVAGAVQAIYGSSRGLTAKDAQLVSLVSAGVAGDPVPYDEFGRAWASADLDRDGFADPIALTTRRIVVLYGSPWDYAAAASFSRRRYAGATTHT